MSQHLLEGLNPSQTEAVTHPDGSILVLAGAGSGKTRIITLRIAYLLENAGVHPSNILAVTFTNKAANEMKDRVRKMVSPEASAKLWLGTFHSICLRILKREIDKLDGFSKDFVIFDDGDQLRLIRDCIKRLDYNEKILEPKAVRSKIDSAKNKDIHPLDIATDIYEERIGKIYDLYQEELRRNNALDFGDLIGVSIKLFKENPDVLEKYSGKFEHIFVDEYQDTNKLQYDLIKMLSAKHRNVFIVGDDNQSIYGWRGADISNILHFENDFAEAKVIKLEQNYRSTKNILNAANLLISHNKQRREKKLWTENEDGEIIGYYEAKDEKDEAYYVGELILKDIRTAKRRPGDFAVFYRTNHQSRLIEDELIKRNIPHSLVGTVSFYSRTEIKNLLAYLRVIVNPLDDISLKRIINVPARGIGKTTVDALQKLSQSRKISLFDAINIALEEDELSAQATSKLKKFKELTEDFINKSSIAKVDKLLSYVLNKTGYLKTLAEDQERVSNVSELLNEASDFVKTHDGASVHDFLDKITLTSSADTQDGSAEGVKLMTLHLAKGLEFPVVFIIGMEENLFPHFKSRGSRIQLEEERRLFYVGITRAKEKVHLTGTSSRRFFGEEKTPIPSRFISEIPKHLLKWESFRVDEYNRDYAPKSNGYRQNKYSFKTNGRHKPVKTNGFTPKPKHINGNGNQNGHTSYYLIGEQVEHKAFGLGIVMKIDGADEDAKLTISFPGRGTKMIKANFAGLKKS